MSNPIINPWWIYFINVLDNIGVTAIILSVFGGAGLVVGGLFYFMWRHDSYSPTYEDDVEMNNIYKRMLKRVATITTLALMLNALIPSEKVMYTMFVANYVTVENLELTGEAVTDMVDYIFEKVDELGED